MGVPWLAAAAAGRTPRAAHAHAISKRLSAGSNALFDTPHATMQTVAFTVSAPVAVRATGAKAAPAAALPAPLLASHAARPSRIFLSQPPPRLPRHLRVRVASVGCPGTSTYSTLRPRSPVRVMPRCAAQGLRCRPHRHRHRARLLAGVGTGAARQNLSSLATRNWGGTACGRSAGDRGRAGRTAGSHCAGGRQNGGTGERQADRSCKPPYSRHLTPGG